MDSSSVAEYLERVGQQQVITLSASRQLIYLIWHIHCEHIHYEGIHIHISISFYLFVLLINSQLTWWASLANEKRQNKCMWYCTNLIGWIAFGLVMVSNRWENDAHKCSDFIFAFSLHFSSIKWIRKYFYEKFHTICQTICSSSVCACVCQEAVCLCMLRLCQISFRRGKK